jgi:hypothetical protein
VREADLREIRQIIGTGFPETCHLLSKENSPQALQPAGRPVDWLGLTEAVTLVAPRSFRYPAQRVTGGSAHTHGLFARDVPDFPDQRVFRNNP